MKNIKIMEKFHFDCLQGMYFSKLVEKNSYVLLSSDLIDDSYYNYCAKMTLCNKKFEDEWNEVKNYFLSINRIPSLYVTPSSDLYCSMIIKQFGLKKQYTDAWMIMDNPQILADAKKNVNISIEIVDSYVDFDLFVKTFREAYSGDNPEDPYANLSQTYVESLKKSYDISDSFSRHNYLATINGVPAGVATVIEADGIVAVYNVGTITKYRKKGVGKALMARIAKDFSNAKLLFLQTEYNSYVEKWYKDMGYKTVFLGECYS